MVCNFQFKANREQEAVRAFILSSYSAHFATGLLWLYDLLQPSSDTSISLSFRYILQTLAVETGFEVLGHRPQRSTIQVGPTRMARLFYQH
jgi:hypothetical protein